MSALRCVGLSLLAASGSSLPVVHRRDSSDLLVTVQADVQSEALQSINLAYLRDTIASSASAHFGYETSVSLTDSRRRLQSGGTSLMVRYTVLCS
eukprot:SAG31_NODE_2081_length_6493_cov_2.552393_1_plen_94_part_10